MPNVGAVLKSEISRLSKKIVKQEVASIRAATTAQRKLIAGLRDELHKAHKEIAALRQGLGGRAKAKAQEPEEGGAQYRFRANGFRTLRARLDLSAEECGRLIDVSAQTIYSWESGKTAPRQRQLPAIAALRRMGKKEARARLQQEQAPAA